MTLLRYTEVKSKLTVPKIRLRMSKDMTFSIYSELATHYQMWELFGAKNSNSYMNNIVNISVNVTSPLRVYVKAYYIVMP